MTQKTIAEKLTDRAARQPGQFMSKRGGAIFFDERHLPPMRTVNSWQQSGTDQWGLDELALFPPNSAEDLAQQIAKLDSWIVMAAVAEVLMHNEEDKARKLARRITDLNPEHRNSLIFYFGEEITSDLLK